MSLWIAFVEPSTVWLIEAPSAAAAQVWLVPQRSPLPPKWILPLDDERVATSMPCLVCGG